ncbi:MAG: hypothetical protein WCL43_00160 [Chlorobium sp.]|jgi:hypothetical protein|nr:MAG: hypothetical protein FDX12_05715 [Chlorobium sp.]
MMITVLLFINIVLLLGILALLLIGWPGRELKEIEKIGRELRRELAQQRADSIQLLHAMRIELEESIRETLENQCGSLELMNRRSSSGQNKLSFNGQKGHTMRDEENTDTESIADLVVKPSKNHHNDFPESNRQLLLFQEIEEIEKKLPVDSEYVMGSVFEDDDLPDIEEEVDKC